MDSRRRVAIITAICGFSLGVGIPLLGLTALPGTETVDGVVLWVSPSHHALLLHETSGPADGRNVMIHIMDRTAPRVQPGNQSLTVLRAGEHIRVTISHHTHWAHAITLENT